ncbi:hypothetical protein RchiOBHm_Chr7g0224971 [Rosa chinensis]|uniref:Uncharacterized protein n=1 Tax=Rosa chinensis TaxID=74649 RepID=A0A2P6PDY5_ROSCH|nr:hypothetical protein RchiOBHm_Chr7g0224971 [Rosa chinensis]
MGNLVSENLLTHKAIRFINQLAIVLAFNITARYEIELQNYRSKISKKISSKQLVRRVEKSTFTKAYKHGFTTFCIDMHVL